VLQGRIILEPKSVEITLIPLRLIFKQILEHSNVIDVMLNNLKCLKENVDPHIIYSFTQSKLWKDKIYGCENNILLFLYYDDFQVNNPLGSHLGS